MGSELHSSHSLVIYVLKLPSRVCGKAMIKMAPATSTPKMMNKDTKNVTNKHWFSFMPPKQPKKPENLVKE